MSDSAQVSAFHSPASCRMQLTPEFLWLLQNGEPGDMDLIEASRVSDVVIEETTEQSRTWIMRKVVNTKYTVWADARCAVTI